MQVLDHWHPVLLVKDYPGHPLALCLHGQHIALFKTQSGTWSAVDDQCIHRRMSLSKGQVQGENLLCGYHNWCYHRDGNVKSPANPKLKLQAKTYEVRAHSDVIWLRNTESTSQFPGLSSEGFDPTGWVTTLTNMPLHILLDNFCEVEHTPTVHDYFGYKDLSQVNIDVKHTPNSVRVINEGPQKPLPAPLVKLLGIQKSDHFIDDWTTYFSPIHCVYDQYWRCSSTGEKRTEHLKIYVFFTPINVEQTQVFVHVTAQSRWTNPIIAKLMSPVLMAMVKREVMFDVNQLQGLRSRDGSLKGMKLGRFDKALGLNRQRIERIYFAKSGDAPTK